MTITIVNAHHLKGTQPVKCRTISRPSPLGNPYRVSETCTREQAITLYKPWLWNHIKQGSGSVYQELIELRDRYLAGDELILSCWCKPLPCHGDVVAAAIEYLAQQRKQSRLAVGDQVAWSKSFPHLSFLEPFEIRAIDGDLAYLQWISTPVKLSELEKVNA